MPAQMELFDDDIDLDLAAFARRAQAPALRVRAAARRSDRSRPAVGRCPPGVARAYCNALRDLLAAPTTPTTEETR